MRATHQGSRRKASVAPRSGYAARACGVEEPLSLSRTRCSALAVHSRCGTPVAYLFREVTGAPGLRPAEGASAPQAGLQCIASLRTCCIAPGARRAPEKIMHAKVFGPSPLRTLAPGMGQKPWPGPEGLKARSNRHFRNARPDADNADRNEHTCRRPAENAAMERRKARRPLQRARPERGTV